MRQGLLALLCVGLLACTHAENDSLPQGSEFVQSPELMGNHIIGVVKTGDGLACYFDGGVGPPSYPVSDIGKAGVPRPRAGEIATLHLILHYIHPLALRFAYIKGHNGREFILFNAPPERLCDPELTGFFVLNGACNEFYEPLNLDVLGAWPDCDSPPRPWVKGDPGVGTGCTWSLDSKTSCD
jgi:hypothetical protein